MIQIKNIEVFRTLLGVTYHPIMLDMLTWIDNIVNDMMITCGYRTGDKGVHGIIPCRGIDLRSWIYSDPKKIVDNINENWEYDNKRPSKQCAILHNTGSGEHIHLQVHPNTVRRK